MSRDALKELSEWLNHNPNLYIRCAELDQSIASLKKRAELREYDIHKQETEYFTIFSDTLESAILAALDKAKEGK